MLKVFKIAILGAPASGKGTISSRILKNYEFKHVSSGDLLRLHIKNNTSLGIEAKKYIDQGQLVPDHFMVKFILSELTKLNNQSWLLDGFPRTRSQAEQLWSAQPLNFVINLEVPFEVIIDRVKGRFIHLPSGRVYNTDFNAPKVQGKDDVTGEDLIQREDDKPEAVKKRLQIYEEMTKPVVEFYKEKSILHTFQGKTTNEIWPKIVKFLAENLK
ncbi:GTP:AMP phosphotransferase AK3, mitochondrial [Chrysoperla carnea]|uniref:GTP:AMP phosphotransferase AK3, mitochondrial n=1 Tax=Chrysoperla carnea TaxID=189513 RepID=UPI001D0662FA|nr:GTP:AMP phosphotransferase AK3, mitochondrial [Chrysoperla carnea]